MLLRFQESPEDFYCIMRKTLYLANRMSDPSFVYVVLPKVLPRNLLYLASQPKVAKCMFPNVLQILSVLVKNKRSKSASVSVRLHTVVWIFYSKNVFRL